MREDKPAFPTDQQVFQGMTLRQWYAGLAMAGMIAGITKFREDTDVRIIVNQPKDISELAFLYADCMLTEASKGKGES